MHRNFPALVILVAVCSATVSAVAQADNPIEEFTKYRDRQNWTEALDVIRREIASSGPAFSDSVYFVNIRGIALSALGNYARHRGYDTALDEEARRYYEEALVHARQDDRLLAGLYHLYGLYFSLTVRNGMAIPYLNLEIELWEKLEDTYQIILVQDAKAAIYNDMGEIALRNFYRKKALDMAADFFVFGKHPKASNLWLEYSRMLKSYADNISRSGDIEELRRVLDLHGKISRKYLKGRSKTYISHAEFYAIAGVDELAAENLERAEKALAKDRKRYRRSFKKGYWDNVGVDIECTRARLFFEQKLFARAVNTLAVCEHGWKAAGKEPGGSTLGLWGLMHEAGGDDANASRLYTRSIIDNEKTRSSFDVTQRAAFFRQKLARRAYWGLIRTLGRKASDSGRDDDFFAFLQASERIRARQFGELVAGEQGAAISIELLETYRDRLDADTAVVTYILTDAAFIVGAFTRDAHTMRIIPYDREAFRAQIRTIVSLLATPSSSQAVLQRLLLKTGEIVVGEIRGLIEDKQQLVVVTDGELNLVPFELWSVDKEHYQPLLELKIIRSAPALRLLATDVSDTEQTDASGLFALGDPVYAEPETVAGVPAGDIEQATRSVNFRSYFTPLPETRSEVESIAQLFIDQPTSLLLGTNALESTVKTSALENYRYLHFATHGILGGEVPGIGEPALVLGDEPGEDGFLKASEAENLSLNAELAVLSACNTGSGEFVSGEGVMGISRSFLLAGSRSVLVSLWPVASKTTEDLMVRFYSYIRDGIPLADALRAAKIDIMETLPHPFFWAPFILVSQQ